MKRKYILQFFSVFLAILIFFINPVSSYAAENYTLNSVEETRKAVSDEIVEIAKAEIGFYESDINKFTDWYYGRNTESSWCCIFVSWCAAQVGVVDSAIPQRASCDAMRTWFRLRNEYYPIDSFYIPQKGDIVFYNVDVDGTDNVNHVEIVTENGYLLYNDTICVRSIGGNTSNLNYQGSQYVMEKYRPVDGPKAQVVGFCHPSYEKGEQLIGKINTYSDKMRNENMKYIHSKFISLITYLESIWYDIFNVFYNTKMF